MKHLRFFEEYNSEKCLDLIRSNLHGSNKDFDSLLKDPEVNINYQNLHGDTALMWAAVSDNIDRIRKLIDAGADWNLKNNKGFDFFNYLDDGLAQEVIKEYSEKYKEYLFRKKTDKYNL